MAHKKGQGSSTNGRDSQPKYLGIKSGDGKMINAGTIIVRQRGTQFHPGKFVGCGRDYTLYALSAGKVCFERRANRKVVHIIPVEASEKN